MTTAIDGHDPIPRIYPWEEKADDEAAHRSRRRGRQAGSILAIEEAMAMEALEQSHGDQIDADDVTVLLCAARRVVVHDYEHCLPDNQERERVMRLVEAAGSIASAVALKMRRCA